MIDEKETFSGSVGGIMKAPPTFLPMEGTSLAMRQKFAPSFFDSDNDKNIEIFDKNAYWNVNYTDLKDPKVPLESLTQFMPVTAAGYTLKLPTLGVIG